MIASRSPPPLGRARSCVAGEPTDLAPIAELAFASLAAGYAYAIARCGDIRSAVQSLPLRDRNLMLIGCALIVGCFFTAENAPYRGIYFLFILPGLPGLWREVSSAAARLRLKLVTGAILFLMWDPFLHLALDQTGAAFGLGTIYSNTYWLLREATWWWVVSVLLALSFGIFFAATGRSSLTTNGGAKAVWS